MSRNGQYGQGRPAQRRNPAEQDPYAPQWPQQPGGYPDPNYANGGQQGYAPQSNQGYHYPPEPEPYGGYPQNGQGQQMPSLDRFAPQNGAAAPYQAQPAQPQWGQQDPRNYDLGSYMPNGAQGYAPPQEAAYAPPQQQGYAPETDGDYDDGLADGEDEPRSGRRWAVIAVALVGAIGLGGGLAYTYKVLFTNSSGRAPFVRNVEPPSKVKPVTGGRESAQVDKKLFTRLGEDGGGPAGTEPEAAQDGSGDAQVGGPRPVRIIPISPGGGQGPGQGPGQGQVSATGSADAGARPGGGGSPMVTIPGLMIDSSGPPRGRPMQPGPQQAMGPGMPQQQQGAPVRVAALPQQQTQQAATEPVVLPPKRPAAVVPTTPSATGATQTAPRVPVPKKETSTASVGPAAGAGGPVSSGYVAVLSSKKSRMDAMKAYASLDQKYRDMLSSSTFDVQEADLGDKGIWYRAVVGPPRSYEGAKKICEDLKTAGLTDCWPARY